MIQSKQTLVARISSRGNLRGSLNQAIVKEYPELENLEVTPSGEQQIFKSNKYGYDTVTVDAIEGEKLTVTPTATEQTRKGVFTSVTVKAVESESLNIVPSTEEQVKEGMFNKVTVAGESNLVAENIKEGTSIFGVEGSAKTTSVKITNASYLFYYGARLDYMNEILELCEDIVSTAYMFYQSASSLQGTLDLNMLNTSKVTFMNNMFTYCNSLTNLIIDNFDTSNVTNMNGMFEHCALLKELDLSSFNTSKVKEMGDMFGYCDDLVALDLSNFNTSNVTKMSSMFYACSGLKNINLSSFDTSNVTAMSNMFYSCKSLENLDLSNFDFGKAKDIANMFNSCNNLVNLKSFKNLGKGYTQKTNNSGSYKLNLSASNNLTLESLMDVINNLYDLNLTYNVANGGTLYTQTLQLGSTNKAKLTAEEIAIATSRGWTVS